MAPDTATDDKTEPDTPSHPDRDTVQRLRDVLAEDMTLDHPEDGSITILTIKREHYGRPSSRGRTDRIKYETDDGAQVYTDDRDVAFMLVNAWRVDPSDCPHDDTRTVPHHKNPKVGLTACTDCGEVL